ncbi:hypothetical protein [Lysobacter sp. CA199]|uniref:hypothetical protein n=1 Tax=Lysobacter sp. CA199 TaxID=3455608 RepID=UPI003F8D8986
MTADVAADFAEGLVAADLTGSRLPDARLAGAGLPALRVPREGAALRRVGVRLVAMLTTSYRDIRKRIFRTAKIGLPVERP